MGFILKNIVTFNKALENLSMSILKLITIGESSHESGVVILNLQKLKDKENHVVEYEEGNTVGF